MKKLINMVLLQKLVKFPILKRFIPSLTIRFLKLFKKNRGYFKVKNIEMFLDFLDPIDRHIILYQKYEDLEFSFLTKHIRNYKINYFLDVGANCGYYSINIALEFPDIMIFSYEPNNEAYFKFSKSLEKNPSLSKKISLNKFGLSNKSDKLLMQSKIKFGYTQTGGGTIINNNKIKNYPTFVGDFKLGDENINLIDEKIAIKIDVESHELNVLLGMKKTLQKNKCLLQVEIYKKNFERINNHLLSLGYKLFYEVTDRSNYFYKNFN